MTARTRTQLAKSDIAEKTVKNHNESDDIELDVGIVNLLVDLRHLCVAIGYDFAQLSRFAEQQFNAEKRR